MLDKNKLHERLETKSFEIKNGAVNGNPFIWHRIIMGAIVAILGLFFMGAIILNFVLERQTYEVRHTPVVGATENAVLPEGDYNIYAIYFDENKINHYLVSLTDGGVVVSVLAPDDTEVPQDILRMVKYDPATYKLHVNQDGSWNFMPSSVHEKLVAHIQQEEARAAQAREGQTANSQPAGNQPVGNPPIKTQP